MEASQKLQPERWASKPKRWNSVPELIREIDRVKGEVTFQRMAASKLEDEADALRSVNSYEATVSAKAKLKLADEKFRKATRLENDRLPYLQRKLAELQTPELPGCSVCDKDGKPVTGIPS